MNKRSSGEAAQLRSQQLTNKQNRKATIMTTDNPEDIAMPLSIAEQLELAELEKSLASELGEIQGNSSNETLSFSEIYSSVLLSGEIIITIHADMEEKVKQGLKNFKAKQAMRDKEKGLPPDSNILNFKASKSDIEGAVDLSIALVPKNLVPVLRIKIPDQTF